MWLSNGWTAKNIFTLLCFCLGMVLLADLIFGQQVSLLLLGGLLSYIIYLVWQIYHHGFYRLIKISARFDQKYQLRQRIYPLRATKSYQEIALLGSTAVISRLYLDQSLNQSWAYLDGIRLLLQKTSTHKILLLGVGGGSLIATLTSLEQAPHVDGMDIDQCMIDVAQEYFLNQVENYNLVTGDALTYQRSFPKQYDLLIIDLFLGDKLDLRFAQTAFIKKVKTSLKHNGHLVINLSLDNNINLFIKQWSKFFPTYLYWCRSNFLLSNIKLSPKQLSKDCRLVASYPLSSS